MTVSKPCYFGNLLLGIVGVDVNLAYILEDVTYYQDSLASYTFLIDDKGKLLKLIRGKSDFFSILKKKICRYSDHNQVGNDSISTSPITRTTTYSRTP